MSESVNMISRSDAAALIPEQVSSQILQELPTQSVFLRLANRMPNMTAKQTKIPVMTGNVTASFLSGDTTLKSTSKLTWDNVYITAEEIAVIVPIPEAVLDDANYDIWAEVRPRISEAFGKAIDAAAFFGTNKPDSWPTGIVPAAITAGNAVAAGRNLYQSINGEFGVVAKVENQNIPVTSYVGALALRSKLRGAVDANGQPIFRTAYSNGSAGSFVAELNGVPVEFPDNGSWEIDPDDTNALLIAGNFRYARYAIRQDITFKILDQAVITDSDGAVILNLAQQDCVALRAVMRLGWALPKPVNSVSGTDYYPFAVLTDEGTGGIIDEINFDVTAPAKGGTAQAAIEADEGYSVDLEWSPNVTTFGASTVYTATATYIAESGYKFADNFGKANVDELPTTGSSGTASSVIVDRVRDDQVIVKVKYKATGA